MLRQPFSFPNISGSRAKTVHRTFLAGDPLIGQPVNFGPDTYLAENNDASDTPGNPAPEEYYQAGLGVMALLELNIGAAFAPPAVYFQERHRSVLLRQRQHRGCCAHGPTPDRPATRGREETARILDGVPTNRPTQLDDRDRARFRIARMNPGEHKFRASYSGGGKYDHHSSTSPNLLHMIA